MAEKFCITTVQLIYRWQ